jgi:glycosyltransferase involved in cell wall biosynthesis
MAVGEALALGTPVVCLDRGGPVELLRQWESSPGAAVPVSTPRETARQLALAVDKFLSSPPEIPTAPLNPKTSYTEVLLRSYDVARGSVSQEQPG